MAAAANGGAADELVLYVNGQRKLLPRGRGEVTLLQYLRDEGLTGTKLGCGEGGCGACTVMLSTWDAQLQRPTHRAINACLAPLYSVEGCAVVTVEGVGTKKNLHPVQERLAKAHGSQCGFCTPGFVMSMYALLRSSNGRPSEEEIEDSLAGNLCRCTGYRPILEGFRSFAAAPTDDAAYTADALHAAGAPPRAAKAAANGNGVPICPSTGAPCTNGCGGGGHDHDGDGAPHALTGVAEPIFPPELRRRAPRPLAEAGEAVAWHRPLTLPDLLALKAAHPAARLVCGNTEVGIEVKFKGMRYPVLIAPTHVPEMTAVSAEADRIVIGGAVTLTTLEGVLREAVATRPAAATAGCAALLEQLRWFAGRQIRNVSALAGNIVTGSPISDLNPLWVALGARFVCARAGRPQHRAVPARSFFLGYRRVDLQPEEVLVQVELPLTHELEFCAAFKQSHRRDDDIALANAGMRVRLTPAGVVEEAALAFGGVAACTVAAPRAEAALVGKPWSRETLRGALAALAEDIMLPADAPGGMVEFRRALAPSFLFKFFCRVAAALGDPAAAGLDARDASAGAPYHRPPARGLQYYVKPDGADAAGAPLMHASAELQVTGEALYVDDMPRPAGALHAVLVQSERPHARLLSLDAAAAAGPGVAGVFTAADVPGHNAIGPVLHDETLFVPVGGEVTCVGQPLGVVVAETEAAARAAARRVAASAVYEDLPSIMTIDEAIAAGSFIVAPPFTGHALARGDVDAAFGGGVAGLRVIEGEARCGGQEHFYLEPNVSVAVPGEGGEMTVWSSTQNPREGQALVAEVLGVPHNKVVCRCKRLGGGFGGKETRAAPLSCAAAVAAAATRRAVRLVLDRDEDMGTTGHRHPFLCRYRVGFTPDGRVHALDATLYANAGNSLDLTHSIVDRALFHSDNAYNVPHVRLAGHACRTNIPSNTAFRGFGGPQGALFAEVWIDRVAAECGLPPDEVRRLNMYGEGDVTHFGQKLVLNRLGACWDEVHRSGDVAARRAAAAAFNGANRYRKRGVAVTPVKFGIAFTSSFLNQGGALVHLYTDGTLLVTIGGVEMGQGLFTKMAQVASTALGIPVERVHLAETATDKVPNASPTAASASADIYGEAVLNACTQLKERLAPIREALGPDATWPAIANKAWFSRVDLSAHGFMTTPGLRWDWAQPTPAAPQGDPFNYFCYGASASEVELDTLTGDLTVLRTDIVMDVGNSLNPVIDVGQVEGGFVQGMGWLMLEELKWGDAQHPWARPGRLFTAGPGTYKIPTANDMPLDFRVSLLQGAANPRAVYSSKAVGEPPFLLANSVFFAARDAVAAARKDAGVGGWFALDAPATPERLRLACCDEHMAAACGGADKAAVVRAKQSV